MKGPSCRSHRLLFSNVDVRNTNSCMKKSGHPSHSINYISLVAQPKQTTMPMEPKDIE